MEPTERSLRKGSHNSIGGLIDELCDQFEAALIAGQAPDLSRFVSAAPESIQADLRQELELVLHSYENRPRPGADSEEDATELLRPDSIIGVRHPPEVLTSTFVEIHPYKAGGLGEVMRAEDSRCRRQVALKFIRHDVSEDPFCRDQFLLEAEITSRLDHPGVVPVLGIGVSRDNRPFYAMRFIEGEELRALIDRFHQGGYRPSAWRVQLHRLVAHLVAVCRTIDYAHNRGVIHRDVKPENVMIGRFGETLVIDWGLAIPIPRDARARSTGEKTLMPEAKSSSQPTSSASGAGTLGYMSPEQLPDCAIPVSTSSDVFSLGASLYRLLANRAPFDSRSSDVIDTIRRCKFSPPRELEPRVPASLEAICLKAMRHDPGQRYASAGEMADDLQRWMADEPVSVYQEPLTERVVRWSRRHRSWTLSLVSAAIVMMVALGIGALVTARMATREHEQRLVAQQAQAAAEAARKQGLLAAGELGAKVVGGEIEHRWNTLSRAAESAVLRENLMPLPEDEADQTEQMVERRRRIQSWLDSQFAQHHQRMRFISLVVTNAQGVQEARSPYSNDTVGKWWGFRNYFHGGEQSFESEPRREVAPTQSNVISSVYPSGATSELTVAFSVPIWSHDRPDPRASVLGVLSMSLEMADFTEIDTQVGDALLIDLRDSPLSGNGSTRPGLVLYHSHIATQAAPEIEREDGLKWLDAAWIETGIQLTQTATRRTSNLEDHWWVDCPDPVYPRDAPTTAAVWPVKIRGNPAIPWIIMVRERVREDI